MRTRHALFVTAFVATLMSGVGVHALAADSHGHAAGETNKLVLNHGKKWASDQPLRTSMGEIRKVLAAKQEAIDKGTLTPADYQALAATVDAQVAIMVAECKLEPNADANLHLIIAELLAAADAMQGKSASKPVAGAVQAVQAVNRYGQYFDHPGWQALR